jgi:exosome complex component RRP42
MTILPSIKLEYLIKLAKEVKRADGRAFDEYRNIEIEPGIISKAEGSAKVKIGKTQVLVGVKMDVGDPYPDIPEEGVMTTAAELIPLASPDFESGPPKEDAVELARVVDRGIRESEIIKVEKLCIIPGKKIWMIFIDIHILDFDGNLFDAASLASLAALMTAKVPVKTYREKWLLDSFYNMQEKDENIRNYMKNNSKILLDKIQKKESIWEYLEKNNSDLLKIIKKNLPIAWDYWYNNKEDFKLPLKEQEILISVTSVKFGNIVVMDPSLDEEETAEARLTVATDNNGDIRAMQKGLNGTFTEEEVKKVIKASIDNGKKIRELLYKNVGK